jgi:hypothetical protein
MGGFQFFDMKNLAVFPPKIAIFFKFTLGKKNNPFFFLFLFGSKKKSIQALEKKWEKKWERKKDLKKSQGFFLIIRDIVALPIMT